MTMRISGRVAAAVTAAVLVVSLVAVTSPAEAVNDKRWRGYAIAKTGKAAGGWIGGYRIGRTITYRIDPTRLTPRGKLSPVRSTSKVRSKRASSRAAWVAAKYGDYPSRTQSAAVDAVLLHLLKGRKWQIGGKLGAKRLRQSGHAADVRSFARVMLRESAKFAGPYRVRIKRNSPVRGQAAVLGVRVLSAKGKPVAKLPVTVTYGALGQRSGVTNPRGTTTLRWATQTPGVYQVGIRIDRVPSSALRLRSPAKGSRVVIAGRKAAILRQVAGIVKAVPTLSMQPAGRFMVGAKISPRLGVGASILDRQRTATVTLFGPSTTGPRCSGRVARQYQVATRGNGAFSLPAYTLPGAGSYMWRVSLPGDAYNTAASFCGGRIDALRKALVTVESTRKTPDVGSEVAGLVNVTGASTDYVANARVTLYGPFADAAGINCIPRRALRTVTARLTGNGTVRTPRVRVTAKGLYTWRVNAPNGGYTLGDQSPCGQAASRFQVK